MLSGASIDRLMKDSHSQMPEQKEEGTSEQKLGQLYLHVAELVLRQTTSALSAKEIKERGIEKGFFGDHKFGKTPEKSMQARLSTDILAKKTGSKFVRTGRGRFQLRASLQSENLSALDSSQEEYVARRRILRMPAEQVLAVSDRYHGKYLSFQGIDTDSQVILDGLLQSGGPMYLQRASA